MWRPLLFSACLVMLPASVLGYTQSSFFADTPIRIDPEKELRLDKPHEVRDLAYGEFLYDYFQEKYFSAITKALIADYRDQLDHHDEQVQVLVGSLFVGYGLLDEAERIFNDLLEFTTEPGTREQIWFNLAELYYKRGNSEKSLALLDKHFKVPSDTIHTQVSLLYALNHMSRGNLELALEHLRRIKDTEQLNAFAFLNLGSVYSLLEQPDKAERHLAKLLRVQGTSELVKAIKDRAALALGKHYLETAQFDSAQQAFKQIRLNSAAANTGLLGLGWAAFKSDNPKAALAPWMELLNRSATDRAVQEAYINIPYVYENLGALQMALDGYQQASQFYAQEQQRLRNIKTSIQTSDWVDQLTPAINFSFDPMDKIPDFIPPQQTSSLYLYKMFATHDFNEGYRNYRELQRLMQVLNHWHKQIPIFHEMIRTHVERMNVLSPKAEQKVAEAERIYRDVSDKLGAISTELGRAIREDDITTTADSAQLSLLDRLNALEATVSELPDTIEYQAEKDRFRILKGLLMWDLNATAIERRWERMKDRVFIENQLVDLERAIGRVKSSRERRIARFAGFKNRIESVATRLEDIYAQCQQALIRQRVFLKGIALEQLDKREAHVTQLQGNAIYAIARLQDMAFSQHRAQSAQMMGEPESLSDSESEDADGIGSAPVTDDTPRTESTPRSQRLKTRQSLFDGSLKSWLGFGDEDEPAPSKNQSSE